LTNFSDGDNIINITTHEIFSRGNYMLDYNQIYNFLMDNIKKIFLPEEWLAIDFEISKQEFLALLVIDKSGEVIMSQVADSLNMPMSTLTGVIDRLVKKGYISRNRNENDRRIVTISLTEKGRELTEKIKIIVMDYIKGIYNILSEEEVQILFTIGNKIVNHLHQVTSDTRQQEDKQRKVVKIEIE
jgi:DNA-binding MarR family transcriptional regulator